MKRTLFLTLIALSLMATTSSAGLVPSYGIKGGLNISKINIEDIESSTQTGYVGGVFMDLGSPLLHLQAELLYSNRKSNLEGFSTTTYQVEIKNHYIQVPVLAKFGLPIPVASPSVYLGPEVSIPIKSQMTTVDGDWVDVKDFNKSLVWSMIIGADLKLMDRLILDIRYDIGMSTLNDTAVGDILDDINDEFTEGESYRDIKDRTFSVMVGWQF
jgi:hypothetical protein|nr:porin family protein [Candidatus Krumholzibacteria bacterium]